MSWKLERHVAWQTVGVEAVVVELEAGRALGLNETGALILGSVAQGLPKARIVEALVGRYGVEEATASADFDELMTVLEARRVVARG